MTLIEVVEILLSRSKDGGVRTAIHRWHMVKAIALLTFLVPFSVLGAYVQFEVGNIPLMVMYLVLGPIVAAWAWLAWRRFLAHQNRNGAGVPTSGEEGWET